MSRKATPKPDEKNQRERFIETAREIGASEDPEDFERAFERVVKPKDAPALDRQGSQDPNKINHKAPHR